MIVKSSWHNVLPISDPTTLRTVSENPSLPILPRVKVGAIHYAILHLVWRPAVLCCVEFNNIFMAFVVKSEKNVLGLRMQFCVFLFSCIHLLETFKMRLARDSNAVSLKLFGTEQSIFGTVQVS